METQGVNKGVRYTSTHEPHTHKHTHKHTHTNTHTQTHTHTHTHTHTTPHWFHNPRFVVYQSLYSSIGTGHPPPHLSAMTLHMSNEEEAMNSKYLQERTPYSTTPSQQHPLTSSPPHIITPSQYHTLTRLLLLRSYQRNPNHVTDMNISITVRQLQQQEGDHIKGGSQ